MVVSCSVTVFNKNLELRVKKLSRDSRLELFGDKKKIFVSNDGIYFLWKLLQIHRDSTLDVFMLRTKLEGSYNVVKFIFKFFK